MCYSHLSCCSARLWASLSGSIRGIILFKLKRLSPPRYFNSTIFPAVIFQTLFFCCFFSFLCGALLNAACPVVSCWATWSQDLVTTLPDNYRLIYELEEDDDEEQERVVAEQRPFAASEVFDGFAAIRTPVVLKEYTNHQLFHSCKVAHQLCCNAEAPWLWQDLNDTFFVWLRGEPPFKRALGESVWFWKSTLYKMEKGKGKRWCHHLDIFFLHLINEFRTRESHYFLTARRPWVWLHQGGGAFLCGTDNNCSLWVCTDSLHVPTSSHMHGVRLTKAWMGAWMVVCLSMLALQQTGYLFRVCLASCPVTAGVGSGTNLTLELDKWEGMDGLMDGRMDEWNSVFQHLQLWDGMIKHLCLYFLCLSTSWYLHSLELHGYHAHWNSLALLWQKASKPPFEKQTNKQKNIFTDIE